MTTRFLNRAHGDGQLPDDLAIAGELAQAGIPLMEGIKESFRKFMGGSHEVRTISIGELHGWVFHRHWAYWVAEGPGIPDADAVALHALGLSVRIEGHCADPHPRDYTRGLGAGRYHIDTAEGLRALADTIKAVVARVDQPKVIRTLDDKDVKDELELIMGVICSQPASNNKVEGIRAVQRLQGTSTLPRIPKPEVVKAEDQPKTGGCPEKAKPGGCQRHNLQCGYPRCDAQDPPTE